MMGLILWLTKDIYIACLWVDIKLLDSVQNTFLNQVAPWAIFDKTRLLTRISGCYTCKLLLFKLRSIWVCAGYSGASRAGVILRGEEAFLLQNSGSTLGNLGSKIGCPKQNLVARSKWATRYFARCYSTCNCQQCMKWNAMYCLI